jgi:hypothetical protein
MPAIMMVYGPHERGEEMRDMTLFEYLDFLFGNAFFRMPFIEAMAAIMMGLTLGSVLVGMLRELHRGGRSAPPAQGRKAA